MKLFQFCALIFAGLLLAGCAEKKKTNDIIIQKVETPKPQGPIRMQEYTQQRDVKWLGRNYKVEIHRVADDSLRMVKDETGQKFIDNRISLRIIRSDGTVFFSRSFTKAAFDDYLNDDYRQTGILEGFVFDSSLPPVSAILRLMSISPSLSMSTTSELSASVLILNSTPQVVWLPTKTRMVSNLSFIRCS